jgi:hypothetical protein
MVSYIGEMMVSTADPTKEETWTGIIRTKSSKSQAQNTVTSNIKKKAVAQTAGKLGRIYQFGKFL